MESTSMFSSTFTAISPSSEKGEENSPDWKKLPRDVMVTILEKLPHSEVLKTVQLVCKSWHEACKDPAAWSVIHFNHYETGEEEEKYQKMAFNAVDRSCGFLLKICFEFYGNDLLLLHMAQISNQLRCLRIQCCDDEDISDKALCEAVEKLPLLEELELTLCAFSDSTIRSIGQSCPNLVSFSLNEKGSRYDQDNRIALAIAESMPDIHRLQLIGNRMTNEGLQALLDSCPCLKSLDIRGCFQVDLSGSLGKRCADIMVRDDDDWPPHIWIDDDSESEYNDYDEDEDEVGRYICRHDYDFPWNNDDDDDDSVENYLRSLSD